MDSAAMPEKSSTKHIKDQSKSKTQKPFKCDFYDCDTTFSSPGTKHRHEREFHSSGTVSVCCHCSKSFARNERLKKHERICEKTVERLTGILKNYPTPPSDPYLNDAQQSKPTPGAMSSIGGSIQPENQAPVPQYTYAPISQNTSSPTFSYSVNNKQPPSGVSNSSNLTSTWMVPTTYPPMSKPDFEPQWRDFGVVDSVNIGGRNTSVGFGGTERAVPSTYRSSIAISSPSSFYTDYTAPSIQQPVLSQLTSSRNVAFQDHDEGTNSYSAKFESRRSRVY